MSLSHDPFIRKILSNKQEALDLFIATLPESISEHLLLDKLELIQESFQEDVKRIEILKNLYEYIFRARKDAEDFSKQAIIKEIEGDYMNMLERIREKGREEGLLKGEQIGEQRGKLEGKLEKAMETARNMKNLGLSMEVIVKSVGLSEAELR